jgi:hypothetical protein
MHTSFITKSSIFEDKNNRIMKRNVLLMFSVIVSLMFILPSCGKYEEGPGISLRTKKQRLVGKWIADKYVTDEGSANADDPTTYEFTSSNSFVVEGDLGTTNGTWEFSDDKLSVIATYSLPIVGEFTTTWKILRLTNTELWVLDEDDLQIQLIPAE